MEQTYFGHEHAEISSGVGNRDDRAKYAYHHGAAIARGIVGRICPGLSEVDADWLYDQMLELHMALYSATLFEVHQGSGDGGYDGDDRYSNGWPVIWRAHGTADSSISESVYGDVGEDMPDSSSWMLSPPELAYVDPDEAGEMAGNLDLDAAVSGAWKLLADMHLKGLVEYRRDGAGRIAKTVGDDSKLHPLWVLTEAGSALGEELDSHLDSTN